MKLSFQKNVSPQKASSQFDMTQSTSLVKIESKVWHRQSSINLCADLMQHYRIAGLDIAYFGGVTAIGEDALEAEVVKWQEHTDMLAQRLASFASN